MDSIDNRDPLQWNQTFIPLDLRKRIVKAWLDGKGNAETLGKIFYVSPTKCSEYIGRYLDGYSLETEFEKQHNGKKKEYKKKLDHPVLHKYLLTQCRFKAQSTLKQYRDKFFDEHGIWTSESSLHRFFVRNNISWKKGSRHALESDPVKVFNHMVMLQYLVTNKNQLLYGDESHRNDKTSNPRYGRCPKCERCILKCSFGRGNYKLSLLLFANYLGPAVYDIIYGSVNEKLFNRFVVNKLINIIHEWPGPNSIILLDNIRFHRNKTFRFIIEKSGAYLIYLPSYTPWLNLAEYLFHGIKEQERIRGAKGEYAALLSLIESVESMKNRNWTSILNKMNVL